MNGKDLGKKLREFRTKLRLTQKSLATAAGLSDAYLAQIEIGDRSPSRESLNTLCAALKLEDSQKQELIVLYDEAQRERLQDKVKNREMTLRNTVWASGSGEPNQGELADDRIRKQVVEERDPITNGDNEQRTPAVGDRERTPQQNRSQTRSGTRQMADNPDVIKPAGGVFNNQYYISSDVAGVQRDLVGLSQVIQGIPSVCLVGLGRCGTNIALGVSMLAQKAKDDYEAALVKAASKETDPTPTGTEGTSGSAARRDTRNRERKDIGDLTRKVVRNFFRKFTYNVARVAQAPIYLVIPIVLVGDLDSDMEGRILASEYAPTLQPPYNKLKMLDLSDFHHGGAGNVPVIGEYLTKVILNKDPSSFTKPEWKLYHSYLIDSAGFKENKSRVFFYIFSAGGGTGSGASGEFGLAQQLSYHSRTHHSLSENTTDYTNTGGDPDLVENESSSQGFEPIFSAGIAVLPQFDTSGEVAYSQATHVNAGRLLCKYLAQEWRFSTNKFDDDAVTKLEGFLRPWNALMLISNNMMTQIDEQKSHEIDVTKMEKMANKYVSQQILNVLTAGALTIDYDERFIREAGLNIGDMIRLDANDLYMSIAGPIAVAYAESVVQKKDSSALNLTDVFFRSLDFPRLNSETEGIEGISILPQSSAMYAETLKRFKEATDESKRYSAFSNVKCFVNCPSTVTIISIPKGVDLDSKKLNELKLAQDKVFRHTKLKRYALIVAASSNLSLTTIITRSACLSDEVVALLFAYIKRCFAREEYRDGSDVEDEITRYLTERLPDEAQIRRILRESEDPQEVMLANWNEVKSTYERKYRDLLVDPEKFVPISRVLLTANDVLDALKYITVTLRHKAIPLKTPDLTKLKVN